MSGNLRRDSARAALNAAILTSFAIVQPLFDVIGRAPEFLVAHQATPPAILALTLVLGFAVPAVPALVVFGAWRLNARAGRAEMAVVVALAVALFVMPVLRRAGTIDGWMLVAIGLVIGVAASVLYWRAPAVRTFITWLVPGLIVFPLLFLAKPGIRSLVLPHDTTAQASSNSKTPVVFVIFDQLGLSPLLAPDGTIDRAAHPAFAELAERSTWYRNATAVSDYTKWSVPAILTGRVPVPSSLPIAAHHPASLFTMLGASHRPHVFEPITTMCPVAICGRPDESSTSWVRGMARTLAIAYLRGIAPQDLSARMPTVDQGWNEQDGASSLGASIGVRWYQEHRKGRRGEVLDFIEAIGPEDDSRPTLHYLHVLLPHEPFIYFPEGHRYSIETRLPGLISREHWRDDEWAVTQAEQRYLLQVAYVDRLLGQLLDRLKSSGLYDDALIVVTADHGASFHPDGLFRKVTPGTTADILPVPLFIKAPHQRQGRIDDRNVESIDIVPTIGDMLDIPLAWRPDGASALDARAERAAKRAFHDDAKRQMALPQSLARELEAAVARRYERFGAPAGNPAFIPRISPAHDLVGADLSTLRITDDARGLVDVSVFGDLSEVSLADETLPAYLAGSAVIDGSGPVTLAVALNGRIRMTTQTYGFRHADVDGAWTAVIPPDAFVDGRNDLEIFVVGRDADGPLLRRAFTSSEEDLDVSAVAAAYAWGVKQEGLYPPEWRDETRYRWTREVARFTVPLRDGRAPRTLSVKLLMSGRNGKPLRILVNGCTLYDGKVPAGPWAREFDLAPCGDMGAEATIELRTKEERARNPRDRRRLGVAIERIDFAGG